MGIRNRAQVFKNTLYNLYHKVIIIVIIFLGEKDLRAFAPRIVNAICKVYLAFSLKNLPHLECYIPSIAKKFAILLQCNIVVHCSSVVKKKKNIYIYIFYSTFPKISLSSLSLFMFSSLSSFSLSHLLSPFFRPKHHPFPNINITHHSGSFFFGGLRFGGFCGFFFFFGDRCLKEEVGMV